MTLRKEVNALSVVIQMSDKPVKLKIRYERKKL